LTTEAPILTRDSAQLFFKFFRGQQRAHVQSARMFMLSKWALMFLRAFSKKRKRSFMRVLNMRRARARTAHA
jgi:hypothetical protein